jgi:methionyl-tRNA synthetase
VAKVLEISVTDLFGEPLTRSTREKGSPPRGFVTTQYRLFREVLSEFQVQFYERDDDSKIAVINLLKTVNRFLKSDDVSIAELTLRLERNRFQDSDDGSL